MLLSQLKTHQKELLKTLVGYIQDGKLDEPIAPWPSVNPTTFFSIYLKGEDSFRIKRIFDLDVLADAGLLDFRWNRYGTGKLFTVNEAGYEAVANNFEQTIALDMRDFNIYDIIRAMSGGMVGVETLDDHIELSHVVNDPFLRPKVVETLTASLLASVKPDLSRSDYVKYDTVVRKLRDENLFSRPSIQRLTELTRTLSFMGDISASLETMLKAWAYLYPLLLIGLTRTKEA